MRQEMPEAVSEEILYFPLSLPQVAAVEAAVILLPEAELPVALAEAVLDHQEQEELEILHPFHRHKEIVAGMERQMFVVEAEEQVL